MIYFKKTCCRPTAAEVLLQRLPELQAQFEDPWADADPDGDDDSLPEESAGNNDNGRRRHSRPPRSVLYYLKGYETTISLTPVQLPPRSRILQVKKQLKKYKSHRHGNDCT